jgi:hypothetical protein
MGWEDLDWTDRLTIAIGGGLLRTRNEPSGPIKAAD